MKNNLFFVSAISLTLLISIFANCKKDPVFVKPKFVLVGGTPMHRAGISVMTQDHKICFASQMVGGAVLQKVDPNGELIWTSPAFADQIYAVAQSPSGEIFACGFTSRNFSTNKYDALLYKFNANGDTSWTRSFGGSEEEYGMGLLATADGHLILSGIWGDGLGMYGLYMLKLKANGDTVWTRKFPMNNFLTPNHLLEMKNGDILVSAAFTPTGGSRQAFLKRISSDGDPIWEKIKTGSATANVSVEMADGYILTCGAINETFQGQVWIQKSDKDGNKIWDKQYGAEEHQEEAMDMALNADGSLILTGVVRLGFLTQAMIFRIDGDGNSLQDMRFGESGFDVGINVLKDQNDDNILLGQSQNQTFLVRTDSKGRFK